MTKEQFVAIVLEANDRRLQLLERKGKEYTSDNDRLRQFKKTGVMESKLPTETLFSMADKHITSIADMVKVPDEYTVRQWRSKLDDLRNYCDLLEALIIDMRME